MLRKTVMVLATAAIFTAVLTADAFARGFGGGFTGGGFRAPIIRSAIPRIHGGPFAHFPHRHSRYGAPWYSGYDYDLPWYGYYDPSTVGPTSSSPIPPLSFRRRPRPMEPRATPARLGECSVGGASVIGSGILEAAIRPQLVSATVR